MQSLSFEHPALVPTELTPVEVPAPTPAALSAPLTARAEDLRGAARAWWRRMRRPRPLRDRFLSENLRTVVSMLLALLAVLLATVLVPVLRPLGTDLRGQGLAALLVLMIIAVSLHSLAFAALTHRALRERPHALLAAVARLPRARQGVRLYSILVGRSGAGSEVLQLVVTAGIAILLLALRPEGVPVPYLLVLTVASIVTAWIGSVMTFALEYAAEDTHGEAFDLPGTPGPDRSLTEYVYAAVLIQTSAGSNELVPLTARARRLVRDHAILSHLTSTIIITLAVSAVITAVV